MPHHQTADGISLYYETHEEGASPGCPWVVFLNGMTQTTMNWKSQARQLEGRARVLMMDSRGQGKSAIGERELTLSLHAADLAGLLSALGVEAAHVVGFSHGARVALALANEHPERLRRLVLCSATAKPTALAQTIVRSWREVLRVGGLEAMSWSSLPTILGDRFLAEHASLLDGIIKASVRRNSPEGVARQLDAMIAYPELSALARGVRAPTLVLSADQDLLVDHEGAALLATLTAGQHVHLQGLGHTIPIEAPERFHEQIARFLQL